MSYLQINLTFIIRRTRLNQDGEAPILGRVSDSKDRAEFATRLTVNPKVWDAEANKAKGNDRSARQINEQLREWQMLFMEHCRDMRQSGKPLHVAELRDRMLGKTEKMSTIIELFEKHNADMTERIGKDYAPLTIQRYNAALKHLRDFIRVKYRRSDRYLAEIDHAFLTGFEHYLKVKADCQHNTAMKHMKSLKKMINMALANDLIRLDPFRNYVISIKPVNKDFLTDEELSVLMEKNFSIPRIATVRDLFLFQCFTGLSYSDLAQLREEHIKSHHGGQLWIMTERTKTGVACNIPLLPPALAILDKYRDHPCRSYLKKTLFPIMSNQRMNSYLKEVADLCGIGKDLTTHMARHTFATTVTLANDVSLESVSKMLGHRKIQTTQIYARILDTKVHREMSKLNCRFVDASLAIT